MFIVGLDLGQSQDFTALSVIEQVIPEHPREYHIRGLKRFKLGTPYPEIVSEVGKVITHPDLGAVGEVQLVVDKTGVGAPVVDMIRKAGMHPYAITIHGGDTVTREGKEIRVPKRDLVGVLQVLFQTGRLKISEGIAEAVTLVQELLNFKMKISVSGHDSYEAWREGIHDDLVLSVAMAVWIGESRGQVRVRWI